MITRVIVLNADYTFLNIVDWKRAIRLLEKGKASVVKYSEYVIHSIRGAVKVPAVLRLIKFIRTLFKSRVPFSKKNVMVRDGFRCAYCGIEGVRFTIDHIVPKSKGGKSTFENCVAACRECNNKKGDRSCSEAKMYPRVRAYAPTISEFLRMRVKSLGLTKLIDDVLKGTV